LVDPARATSTLDSRVNITAPAGPAFNVVFNPNGSATGIEICIENISDSSDRREVKVYNITGRVEILDAC
jgi:hypothetical protein